ncbi:MAG: hypothetical protein LUE11_00285 [Clostridia bacterium]|nr:hypothetical protein [Clostridia bacterium]
MKKLFKKLATLAMAAVMMVGMGAAAFAANTTNARFVKDTGDELKFSMGTKVINSVETTSDGKIKVSLKPAEVKTTILGAEIGFTGSITSVLQNNEEILTTEDENSNTLANPYFIVDPSSATTISGKDFKGILLTLTFDMDPFTPPGMSDTMNAYFTCDEFIISAE